MALWWKCFLITTLVMATSLLVGSSPIDIITQHSSESKISGDAYASDDLDVAESPKYYITIISGLEDAIPRSSGASSDGDQYYITVLQPSEKRSGEGEGSKTGVTGPIITGEGDENNQEASANTEETSSNEEPTIDETPVEIPTEEGEEGDEESIDLEFPVNIMPTTIEPQVFSAAIAPTCALGFEECGTGCCRSFSSSQSECPPDFVTLRGQCFPL